MSRQLLKATEDLLKHGCACNPASLMNRNAICDRCSVSRSLFHPKSLPSDMYGNEFGRWCVKCVSINCKTCFENECIKVNQIEVFSPKSISFTNGDLAVG